MRASQKHWQAGEFGHRLIGSRETVDQKCVQGASQEARLPLSRRVKPIHPCPMVAVEHLFEHVMVLPRGQVLRFTARPLVMGILNVTPDSFSDGGRFLNVEAATAHAQRMAEAGADLLDIGAESSRPGAIPISQEEELRRLIPVVESVCRVVSLPVSVDTTKAIVARRALEAGAVIVNDISALRGDRRMGQMVAEAGAGLVVMHMQGTPQTMQQSPVYADVVEEVRAFFVERIAAAEGAGIPRTRIMLDPGIGFGKLKEHNLTLIANVGSFTDLGCPVLLGLSRKSFIGQVLQRSVNERVFGTAAAVAMAIERGASVVRVHDVSEIRDVVDIVDAIRRHTSPAVRRYHA